MKNPFLALAFLSVSLCGADNLIRNPEIDGDAWQAEFRKEGARNQIELSRFTEEETGNACLKMELKEFRIDKEGLKHVGAGVMLGGEAKKTGFSCKPDTTYEFEFSFRGDAERAMISFYEWDGNGKYRKQKTSVHTIRPQKEWTVCKGTFRTSASAERAALYIQFWGDEKRHALHEKIGQYILIDKVFIREAGQNKE